MISVLEEPGVHLHLAGEDRLEFAGHVVPRGDVVVPFGQLGVVGDDAEFFLTAEGAGSGGVPTLVELALVLVSPLFGDVVRCVGGARRVVDEEGLVGHQALLLADPLDRVIGHVLTEVVVGIVAVLRLDRHRVAIDRRRPLVGLAADEAVEMLEALPGGPLTEGPHRTRLPHRHLVAIPELSRRVAVELQGLCQRRAAVGDHRRIAGRGGGDLGDASHPHGVMVAAGQQSRSSG